MPVQNVNLKVHTLHALHTSHSAHTLHSPHSTLHTRPAECTLRCLHSTLHTWCSAPFSPPTLPSPVYNGMRTGEECACDVHSGSWVGSGFYTDTCCILLPIAYCCFHISLLRRSVRVALWQLHKDQTSQSGIWHHGHSDCMPEQNLPPVSRRELFLRASGVSFLTGVFSFFSVPVLVNYCLVGIEWYWYWYWDWDGHDGNWYWYRYG